MNRSQISVSIPTIPDMNNDTNSLINSLYNANIFDDNWDEYHEALVSVTSNWDRDIAEQTIKENLIKNPLNYAAYDLLGVLNAQRNETDLAFGYHSKSIEIKPNYIQALHNYGYLCHRLGNDKNDIIGIRYFEKALNINKNFGHCWLHYGNLLEDKGDLEGSLKMYIKAIQIRPNCAPFHLDLANLSDDLNEFNKAKEHYIKCIKLAPNDAVYHWNFAISLENQKNYDLALKYYTQAIRLDEKCVDAPYNLGHMYENMEIPKYRLALNCYEKVLRIQNDHEQSLLRCANIRQKLGHYSQCEQSDTAYIKFGDFLASRNRSEDANSCFQAVKYKFNFILIPFFEFSLLLLFN